jgi:hypothetical protein
MKTQFLFIRRGTPGNARTGAVTRFFAVPELFTIVLKGRKKIVKMLDRDSRL